MELPDFTTFEPFNELRQKMGAEKLGFFELFDPKYHLTGIERSDLERRGLIISMPELHYLLDFTLVYKNTRVMAEAGHVYHLARCDHFSIDMIEVRICTSERALSQPATVCKACLQKLQYKGYDAQKARKEAYSLQVFERFDLNEFWRTHPLYPVSEKRDLRKNLI